MTEQHPFKYRHFQAETILLCVRWYVRQSLSYRDLEELLLERGLPVDHTTISRWVHPDAPELDRRCRAHLKGTTDSWRVDETSVKGKGVWMQLYRAVDSSGHTLDFLCSATRDAQAAQRFLMPTREAAHPVPPRVNTVDTNALYPTALTALKAAAAVSAACERRQRNYRTTLVEQDQRCLKGLVRPGLGCFAFETAGREIQGEESMTRFRKGQIRGVEKGDILGQVACIARLFGVAA